MAGSPKKASPKKRARRPAKPRSHPPTSEMVRAAIAGLKDRRGSSLQAIKGYISSNYKVDMKRMSPFIRRYLRSGVASGALRQSKGTGASGRFRLGATPKKAKKRAKRAKKAKKPRAKKAKKPRAKKAARKPKAKKAAAKKPKAARKPKAKKPAAKKAKPAKKAARRPKGKKAAKK